MKENIRDYDLLLANKLERIKKANISDANKELITRFMYDCFSQGLSKARVLKYVNYLQVLSVWLN